MSMRRVRGVAAASLAWGLTTAAFVACTSNTITIEGDESSDTGTTTLEDEVTSVIVPDPSSEGDDTEDTGSREPDLPPPDNDCTVDGNCPKLDLLLVIDNSGTMGDEQLALANNVEEIVDELQSLTDEFGNPAFLDVNIMVTTTDMGHPLCTAFQKPDYVPAAGAPIYTGCNARINRFTGLDPLDPMSVTEACTDNCPADIAPSGHFIHFDPSGSNVPGNDVIAALQCVLPQGIDGCGFESPLEAMLQALDTTKCWNDPSQPACDDDPEWADVEEGFLRPGGILAVMFFTDELDCSVAVPGGYTYFTDIGNTIYWNINPDFEVPQASSAICFNAGVSCQDAGGDGVFESCDVIDTGVLHPLTRYTGYLDFLANQGKHIVMLGGLGVPPVLARNPSPPFEPTAGGLPDLLYRAWVDAPYPAGDIDPYDWNVLGEGAEHRIWEFGDLGPGCNRVDDLGEFEGQALPPVRIRDVCQSLNTVDESGSTETRCCVESICGVDFSKAIRCISSGIPPAPLGGYG